MRTLLGRLFAVAATGWLSAVAADNQTPDVSPILPGRDLPFRIKIEEADFSLPNGLHSYVVGIHKGKWLLLAGRTNGLHGFNDDPNNFPPSQQNTTVYVVDPVHRTIGSRSLHDSHAKLTQEQIDLLSVTSPQAYQDGDTLYMTGGYGVITATGQFSTKDSLIAIDVPGLMHWVLHDTHKPAADYIRYLFDPIFQVTGGYMDRANKGGDKSNKDGKEHPTLLIFGQNFQGFYFDPVTNGEYTQQVRRFHIKDDGKHLAVEIEHAHPRQPDPSYRRRDLNVVPAIHCKDGKLVEDFIALSGVFTLTGGAWTVPVDITAHGKPSMADPQAPDTFKQGMNNYVCPAVLFFSEETGDMYTTLLGGISYGYFQGAQFQTDAELPFINQVTTIKRDRAGHYKQYIRKSGYPTILSTQSNPGNQLLFGAGGDFLEAEGLPAYDNGVLKFDELVDHCRKYHHRRLLLGYVVGGIESTLPNTNTTSDSAASARIFKVTLEPRVRHRRYRPPTHIIRLSSEKLHEIAEQ